jgi:hypothetical protein
MGLQLRGANELRNKLERLAAGLDDASTDALEHEIRGPLSPYPPERPGQKYRRTYRLQHSLGSYVRPLPSEVQGVLTAAVSYAKWVINKGTQAWMHEGRWWTLQGEAIKLVPRILKRLQDNVRRLLS